MQIQEIRQECLDTINKVRENHPLVHNITNAVVTNVVANTLLAVHASPLMAHDVRELEEINAISSALVVNIGTLDKNQIDSMLVALDFAKKSNKATVLDPVGAGASKLRTQTSLDILKTSAVQIVRANASEIMALASASGHTIQANTSRGVDANDSVQSAISSAKYIAETFSCTVSMTGEKDFVTNGKDSVFIELEDRKTALPFDLITHITGMGCCCSAVHGACLAANSNPLIACASAMAIFKAANSKAIENAQGPASLQVALLDAMYNMSSNEIVDSIILNNV